MSKQMIKINLNAGLQAPSFWDVRGSMYRRSTDGGDFLEAFPEWCDRSQVSAFLIREFEVMRPGIYRGNRVFQATSEKMQAFARNFDPADRPPVQIDHNLSATNTHGEILDVLTVPAMGELPERTIVLTIFKGAYCCERVNDGRWHKFSLGFFEEPTAFIYELSIVTKQAVPTARLSEEERDEIAARTVPAISNNGSERDQVKLSLREASVRMELMALVRSGQSTPAQHEREVDFCLGLGEEQTKRFIALRREMNRTWTPGLSANSPASSKGDEEELAQLCEAAGVRVRREAKRDDDELAELCAAAGIKVESDA